jgi:CheY-like chemotaxis protein/anti-sigma regulatory factor (Ser/Thr protein kinase)
MAWNEIRHRARLARDFGGVPRVEAEEARLGQVFLNLLLNAAQAITEGDVRSNEIRVVTRTDAQGRVVVEVRDSGKGIPDSARGHLFEPFFTTKPAGVGTGLGLYVCRDIVSSLGGEIEFESAEGRGSVFRVSLPPAPGSAAEGAQRSAGRGAHERGCVLVVDDEPMMGSTLTRILGAHDVVAVGSAREALALLDAGRRFDVVLCDLVMPGMSGVDLHAELARRLPDAARRMVFLSGGALTPAARAFVAAGSHEVIDKPFDAAALRVLVARRVAEGRAPEGEGAGGGEGEGAGAGAAPDGGQPGSVR